MRVAGAEHIAATVCAVPTLKSLPGLDRGMGIG